MMIRAFGADDAARFRRELQKTTFSMIADLSAWRCPQLQISGLAGKVLKALPGARRLEFELDTQANNPR